MKDLPFIRLIVCMLLCFPTTSCGVKRLPKPIQPAPAPQIENLDAQVKDGTVVLHWSIADPKTLVQYPSPVTFEIQRAQIDASKKACEECPSPFNERIASLDIAKLPQDMRLKGRFSWVDKNVSATYAYKYRVLLVDRKRRALHQSRTVLVRLLPEPPAAKLVTAVSGSKGVQIEWHYPKLAANQLKLSKKLKFIVERATPKHGWTQVTDVPIQGNSFLDVTVGKGLLYEYRVTSVLDDKGVLVWGKSSNRKKVVAAKSLAPPPPNTVWIIPKQGNLEIHWTETEGTTKGYHVYRKYKGEIIRLTAQPVPAPPYLDKSVKPNAIYSYAVSCVSATAPYKEGLLSKWVEFRNVTFQ